MKKIALIFTAFLGINHIGVSQNSPGIGLSIGLNNARVSTDFATVSDGQKSVNRLNAGLFFNVPLGENFALLPFVHYNGKGLYFDATDHSHTIKMESIDLPIHLTYYISDAIYLGLGPNLGYYMSGTNAVSTGHTHKYTFNDDAFEHKRFDLGASAILGFQTGSGLGAALKYVRGFNDVANLPDNTWKSSVASILLTYKFSKK